MSNNEDDSRITQRYQPQVTQRFETPATDVDPLDIKPNTAGSFSCNEFVGNHFRVLEGPLGGATGEGEVYRCLDEEQQRIVAVKVYRNHSRPKESIIKSLHGLCHPSLIRLLDHGNWNGRFYEVMEFCEGGVASEHLPIPETDLIVFLKPIINGLQYCHQQGIIHRDIKPNNLFFRDLSRQVLIIGDFGISSYLETDEQAVRVTHTAANLTLDYAAPELLDGHAVGPKTDFYALGITLLHLLSGKSPFAGLSNNDILVAHLRGRISFPENISERFATLIKGLTLFDVQARWGHEEISRWLQGETLDLPVNQIPSERHSTAAQLESSPSKPPYPGYSNARTPMELGLMLNEFDATKQLFRGDIRRWIFDYFDPALAERIEVIEETLANKPELGLLKLQYILNPRSPFTIESASEKLTFINLQDLAQAIQQNNLELNTIIEKKFWDHHLDAWIEGTQQAGERTDELLSRLAEIRSRMSPSGHKGIALLALLYVLDPSLPLQLTPKLSIKDPAELGPLFLKHSRQIHQAVKQCIYNHCFEEWLRAGKTGDWHRHVAFIEDTRLRYLDEKEVGAYAVLWHFQPDIPFPFKGQAIKDPKQLATLIDMDADSWGQGEALLNRGWIRAWLVSAEWVRNLSALDSLLLDTNMTTPTKLEALLKQLNPDLAPPEIQIQPRTLTFGNIEAGAPRSRTFMIENHSRGHLAGSIRFKDYGFGITVSPIKFEGNTSEINVTVDAINLEPGGYKTALILESNGGEAELPIIFYVKDEEDNDPWWQKVFDLISPRQ